jgi:hypothetical protein
VHDFRPEKRSCIAHSMRPRPRFGNLWSHAMHGGRNDPRAGRGVEAIPRTYDGLVIVVEDQVRPRPAPLAGPCPG